MSSALAEHPKNVNLDFRKGFVIVRKPILKNIIHSYSDQSQIKDLKVHTYDFYELLAEKIRALFKRTRPRDLYDVVEVFESQQDLDYELLKQVLQQKCALKKLQFLELGLLKLDGCKAGWHDQLSHQLVNLPSFEEYFRRFQVIYKLLGLNIMDLA